MEYEIRELGELKVVGFMERQTPDNNVIDKLWQFLHEGVRYERILEINNGELKGLVAISANFAEDISFDYYVGTATLGESNVEGTTSIVIKPATYAVFKCEKGDTKDLYYKIYGEWAETVDFDFAYTPHIEHHVDTSSCEIYIPIIV